LDTIVAVRVTLQTGEHRYFLTWGRLTVPVWPKTIEMAALDAAARFALGGTPVSATMCDSLLEASGERFFFECLVQMMHAHHPAGRGYERWAEKMMAAIRSGKELYYCGRPREDTPADPDAKCGWTLEWYRRGDDALVGEAELDGISIEFLRDLLGEDDVDALLCLTFLLTREQLATIASAMNLSVDPAEYDYFISPWADRGFRTPGGLTPPPRTLGARARSAKKVRPKRIGR
jgi:hypothetical protein